MSAMPWVNVIETSECDTMLPYLTATGGCCPAAINGMISIGSETGRIRIVGMLVLLKSSMRRTRASNGTGAQ
jgi:hypothetical protein